MTIKEAEKKIAEILQQLYDEHKVEVNYIKTEAYKAAMYSSTEIEEDFKLIGYDVEIKIK